MVNSLYLYSALLSSDPKACYTTFSHRPIHTHIHNKVSKVSKADYVSPISMWFQITLANQLWH